MSQTGVEVFPPEQWSTYMEKPTGGDGGSWRAWSRYLPELRRRAGTPSLHSTLTPQHWAQLGLSVGETGSQAPPAGDNIPDWLRTYIEGIASSRSRSGSGSGSSKAMTAAELYALQRQKQEDSRSDYAQAALRDWYLSGGHMRRFEGLENALAGISSSGREAAQGDYQRTLANILGGYQAAGQMMDTGYGSTRDYLTANAPQAFAGFQVDPAMAAQASMNYLDAYGVDAAPVQAQVAAEQSALQGGAGAFTTLVDILNRASQQAGQSRLTELNLAENLGRQSLSQQRAAYESQAASAYQRALAEIAAEEAERRYRIEEERGRRQEEADQTIATSPTQAGSRVDVINKAVANNTTLKAVVRETNPGFFKNNPNPTKAQMEKAFPAVAKAFKAAKG